jgi:hypothetical protein
MILATGKDPAVCYFTIHIVVSIDDIHQGVGEITGGM